MIGKTLGPYHVVAKLGEGGMGEVYKATDTRLDRTVAIKVLPEHVASNPELKQRFEREAKTISSLNHPHICTLYDVGNQGGIDFLVMEYLEGETLAQRLTRGALPLDQTLRLAIEIADALDKAHRQGIVHRDMKPGNIMLTRSGGGPPIAKLLDFGLAKRQPPAAVAGSSMAATVSGPLTGQGTILGTLHYMAPEQVEGQEADARSDLFSFGAVLHEMATGQRAFEGKSAASVMVAVLEHTPPAMSTLQPLTPPALDHLVSQCLAKDPDERWQTAGDVMRELTWITEAGSHARLPARAAARGVGRERLAWISAVSLVGLIAAGMAVWALRPAPSAAETRTEIVTPATAYPVSFALSPDGSQIVFVASGDGASRLWLRSLASTTAQPLAGTEGAVYPFWSPDSRSVGFFADGRLKRIDIGGGAPQTVATAPSGRGGTWNADGMILFTPNATVGPLFLVPASGGTAAAVTKLDRQSDQLFPFFLPDGRQFLFYGQGTPETQGIYLGSLESGESKRLTPDGTAGVYLSSGALLWVRAGTLVAQRLDLERKALTGNPVTLADSVVFEVNFGAGAVSVSASGLVAYRTGGASPRQLAWFDRAGQALGVLGPPDERDLGAPSVSPDGRPAAVRRTVQGNTDIFLVDDARMSRFTFDAAVDRLPIWSPDGSRIVFDSNRKGLRHLYQKPSSGAGVEELLVESDQNKIPSDWSADGRFLLYFSIDPKTDRDLWVLPMEGDRKPWVFLKTSFSEKVGQFSPDGRWVAYVSNESGRSEVYVRPFVEPTAPGATGKAAGAAGGQWQVSAAGGIYPRWRPDGRELYYIGPNGEIMAAPITATGTTLEPGTPVVLFPTRIFGGGVDNQQHWQYDVTRDGRFLINTVLDDTSAPITLLQNWQPGN